MRKTNAKILCVIALQMGGVFLWGGCVRFPTMEVSVRRGNPFVITCSDTNEGWGHVSHPYLLSVSTGRIALTYFITGDPPGSSRAAADWPAYSDDGGKTWSFGDPFNWAHGITPTNLNHPVSVTRGAPTPIFNMGYYFGAVALSNGVRVVQYYLPKRARPGLFYNNGLRSVDDGQTWTGPEVVTYNAPTNMSHNAICLSPKGVQLSDGSLLCIGYSRFADNLEVRSCVLFKSVDEGRTYNYLSTVAGPRDASWGRDGPCEPGLVQLPDDGLVCLIRTGGGGLGLCSAQNMLLARSPDGGETWRIKELLVPGVMPGLLRLQNGILVAVYGRPGNCMMFSTDQGRTWGNEIPITALDIRTSGYLDMLEVAPNRILLVYDTYDAPLSKMWLWDPPDVVNAVWGMFMDITLYPWAATPR